MSYRFALLAAAGTLALGTASAQAQDDAGYYGTLGVGYSFESGENDFETVENDFPTLDAQQFESELDLSGGPAFYGALGKYFANGFRGEIELSYRERDVDSIPGDGLGLAGFPNNGEDLGRVQVSALMANFYKDLPFDAAGRFVPYVGAGVGIAKVRGEFDNVTGAQAQTDASINSGIAGPLPYRIYVSNDDYAPAFQGLAGVKLAISETVGLNIGYRYMQTGEYEYDGFVNNEPAELQGEFRSHEAMVGLRWEFGARETVAAAPTPVVRAEPRTKTCLDGTVVNVNAPCPEIEEEDALTPAELRTVVYFDFDRADLTPAARSLLQRRAREAQSVDLITVMVAGNTDTSGSSAYNERLSARRGAVVREALVSYGVSADKIEVRALGESNLAKPTADGVREPLNRRTEIEFDF
jgi:outer membrane protein OmpA-like peptidoglycan-associated protein